MRATGRVGRNSRTMKIDIWINVNINNTFKSRAVGLIDKSNGLSINISYNRSMSIYSINRIFYNLL